MERFEDGLACRIYYNSATAWGHKDADWDALTEEQRQIYRDFANRLPFKQHDPSLSEKFTPTS